MGSYFQTLTPLQLESVLQVVQYKIDLVKTKEPVVQRQYRTLLSKFKPAIVNRLNGMTAEELEKLKNILVSTIAKKKTDDEDEEESDYLPSGSRRGCRIMATGVERCNFPSPR